MRVLSVQSLFQLAVLVLVVFTSHPVFAEPLRVLWEEDQKELVAVQSTLQEQEVKECVEAGLELEHRFLFKFCEKANQLGMRCGDNLRVIHTFSFDPIQESFRVTKDILGDALEPKHESVAPFDAAISVLSQVDRLSLSQVGDEESFSKFSRQDGVWYLGARVRTRCKGEFPKFLADVSYFLTLGLLDFYGDDTGWEYYVLTPEKDSDQISLKDSQSPASTPNSD